MNEQQNGRVSGMAVQNFPVTHPPRRSRRILARLPTYWVNVRDNPKWLPMFVFGRLLPIREVLWRLSPKPKAKDYSTSMFPGVSVPASAEELRAEGLCLGLQLPQAICDEIVRFARATPCFGSLNRSLEFLPAEHSAAVQRFHRPILVGHYFYRIEDCPALVSVRDDPLLHAIAANYLGGTSRVISTRLWWSFSATDATDLDWGLASQEKLHFDLDDWRALKFFFYLTPVDDDAGPHVYIRKSHTRRLLRHQLTLLVGNPNDQVLSAYGEENRTTVLGGAGFGFGVDPFGFHMGTAVRGEPRLMLEIGFGVSSVLGGRFYGETKTRPAQKGSVPFGLAPEQNGGRVAAE